MSIRTIKGFDHNLCCRGKQYEVGKTYEENGVLEMCGHGMHAISPDVSPLRVFDYYPPTIDGKRSRYCEVDADGEFQKREDKICCSKLTIGAEIGIPGLVKAHAEWVKKHITNENNAEPGKAATAGEYGAATAGYRGAATAGEYGAATAGEYGAATAGEYGAATAGNSGAATAGYRGAATAGYRGAATAGDRGAATAGEYGAATAGDRGAATSGEYGAATAGYGGAATSRGSASVGRHGVAVARNEEARVRGKMGALLVVAIEDYGAYDIKEWKAGVVDGVTLKADTWYTVENGEWKEVTDEQ